MPYNDKKNWVIVPTVQKKAPVVGLRFSKLTIISDEGAIRVGKKHQSSRVVKARCDCGKEDVFTMTALRNGYTTSCGCVAKKHSVALGKARRKAPGHSGFNALINGYRNGALRRKHVFALSSEQFKLLTQKPCAYCGSPPSRISAGASKHGAYAYNGIDRVDNTEGYTVENCVPCCRLCNYMKGPLSSSEFAQHVLKITAHFASAHLVNAQATAFTSLAASTAVFKT